MEKARTRPLTLSIRRRERSLAPVAATHRLVIGHGNGPHVGLLALQGAAYGHVESYPLDVLGAETEGMIGYMIEQELGDLLPFERPFATILTMVEVIRALRIRPAKRTASRATESGRSNVTASCGGASCPLPSPDASSSCARSSSCSSTMRS
jgi:hypothetical protein